MTSFAQLSLDGSVDYKIYKLGDIKLQRGQTLKDAFIAYKSYGVLNAAKDNVIVYPTWFVYFHACGIVYCMR